MFHFRDQHLIKICDICFVWSLIKARLRGFKDIQLSSSYRSSKLLATIQFQHDLVTLPPHSRVVLLIQQWGCAGDFCMFRLSHNRDSGIYGRFFIILFEQGKQSVFLYPVG
ncbi:MAG: hypothetical protein DWQ04_17015 [Chloroflexi bacterium]|nr:MAG: hypothetical protein DWQ04_17015 [Chloroflexota bacterium]